MYECDATPENILTATRLQASVCVDTRKEGSNVYELGYAVQAGTEIIGSVRICTFDAKNASKLTMMSLPGVAVLATNSTFDNIFTFAATTQAVAQGNTFKSLPKAYVYTPTKID